MTTTAQLLRRIAQWLDPQPLTIELLQLDGPPPESLNFRGFPVYFTKIGLGSFSVWPEPDGDYRLCIRRSEGLIDG